MVKSGNYLGKSRINVFLSKKCRQMIYGLTKRKGVSSTAVIELAVREYFAREFPNDPHGDELKDHEALTGFDLTLDRRQR